MVKDLYGSFNLEISNIAQIPSEIFGIYQYFFFYLFCVENHVHMVFWKANKAYSALLLMNGELHSSPQHVIIHESSNPWWETSTVACTLNCHNTAVTLFCWEFRSRWSVGRGNQYLHSKAFLGQSKCSECPVIYWQVRNLPHHPNILFPAVLSF